MRVGRVQSRAGSDWVLRLESSSGREALLLHRNGTMRLDHDGDATTAALVVMDAEERRKRQLSGKTPTLTPSTLTFPAGDVVCEPSCATELKNPCESVDNG